MSKQLTALENVEAPLQVGKRKGQHSARAKELLTLVGLGHRLHHRPNQLSGGEQQRIAIAHALATDPPIVIADEPTGNLDARNGANVLTLIANLRAQTGKTFIIATHDQNVATHADRAVRIVDGLVAGQAQPLRRQEEESRSENLDVFETSFTFATTRWAADIISHLLRGRWGDGDCGIAVCRSHD
jgi:ABC-type lipoprotein export system ATPase subunit